MTGSLPEPAAGVLDPALAVIEGARRLLPGCRNVFSVGGESFALIFYDENGRYREHGVNPPCASGTGSFIEQQARRLGLSVEELDRKAGEHSGRRPRIATRCAVFAKTDIVHAMQEGYSLEAVCAGLCEGLAATLADSLVKGRELAEPVGIVGGVARNAAIVAALGKSLGLTVTAPAHAHLAGAVGAALLGREQGLDVERLLRGTSHRRAARPPLPAGPAVTGLTGMAGEGFRFRQDGEVEVMLRAEAASPTQPAEPPGLRRALHQARSTWAWTWAPPAPSQCSWMGTAASWAGSTPRPPAARWRPCAGCCPPCVRYSPGTAAAWPARPPPARAGA